MEPVFAALLPPLPLPSVLEAGWLSRRTCRNALFLRVPHGWNLLARATLPPRTSSWIGLPQGQLKGTWRERSHQAPAGLGLPRKAKSICGSVVRIRSNLRFCAHIFTWTLFSFY